MDELLFRQEGYEIQGAIFEVSREMGIGFLEAVYQDCLAMEFADRSIPFVMKPDLALQYKGRPISKIYQPDFVCYGKIIVELKVVREFTGAHRAQVLNYLKATGLRVGLLVNCGCYPKAQIERIAL